MQIHSHLVATLPPPKECSLTSDRLAFFGHKLTSSQLRITPRRRDMLDIVGLARGNSVECIEILMDIARSKKYAAFDRISAMKEVLNRGLGKAETSVSIYNQQNNLTINENLKDEAATQNELTPLDGNLSPDQMREYARECASGLLEVLDHVAPDVESSNLGSAESPPLAKMSSIETTAKLISEVSDQIKNHHSGRRASMTFK